MDKEQIKFQVKLDMDGVLAIEPEKYGEYLEWLSSEYYIGLNEARDIAREVLTELPSYMD